MTSSSERSRHFAAFIVAPYRRCSRPCEGLASAPARLAPSDRSVEPLASPAPPARLALPLQGSGARHELRRDADLLRRGTERDARHVLGHADHLVQDAAGLHHGHPFLGISLALAHPRLRWLLRHWLVRKDSDPDLATALETPGERDARGLDLAVGYPARLEGLEAEVAEGERRPARRDALHPPALGLPVVDALRHQHRWAASCFRGRGAEHLALEDPDLDADGAVR